MTECHYEELAVSANRLMREVISSISFLRSSMLSSLGAGKPRLTSPEGRILYFTGTEKGWSFSPSETTRSVRGLVPVFLAL